MLTREPHRLIKPSIVEHLHQVAEWRRWRYREFDRDERNLQSAAGLEELAAFINDLPDSDTRLQALHKHASYGDQFTPGQKTNLAIARFRFYYPDSECDGFLDHLVECALFDKNEQGRFGGTNLPPEDDPWS